MTRRLLSVLASVISGVGGTMILVISLTMLILLLVIEKAHKAVGD